ncbi:MAG TPA: hypothetical protein VNN62_09180 [Methylomirabilota bacterium]|nr:hypothetical protein [Methylomirabilota bacterium]
MAANVLHDDEEGLIATGDLALHVNDSSTLLIELLIAKNCQCREGDSSDNNPDTEPP